MIGSRPVWNPVFLEPDWQARKSDESLFRCSYFGRGDRALADVAESAGTTLRRRQRGAADNGGAADLTTRVAALEKTVRDLERSRQLDQLTSRVASLERQMRSVRPSGSGATSRTGSSDLSQLQRANADLKRAVQALQSQVTTGRQTATQLRREIDRLSATVSTLRSEVDRLKR